MSKIKFKYLYRDAGNYKNYGFKVFRNPNDLTINQIEERLESAFLNRLYFIADQIGLPELFHNDYPTIDDISFHEYDGLELMIDDVKDLSERTVEEFIDNVVQESAVGWKLFDPREMLSDC